MQHIPTLKRIGIVNFLSLIDWNSLGNLCQEAFPFQRNLRAFTLFFLRIGSVKLISLMPYLINSFLSPDLFILKVIEEAFSSDSRKVLRLTLWEKLRTNGETNDKGFPAVTELSLFKKINCSVVKS